MAEFTSSAQVSPTPNQLFQPLLAGQQQQQQNQLQMQRLDLTAADHEQVGRLAAGLLNIKDPAARAQAYAQGVGVLQSQGLAKYAPPTLPDEQSLQMLVSQTVPVTDQFKMGLATAPGQQANFNAVFGTGSTASTGAPGSTTGAAPPATTPPGSGATIGQRQNNPGNLTFAGQPGASPGQGNRFASFPDMPTGVAATADQLALYQQQHGINTVRGAVTRWVSDPKADLTSYIGDVSKALGVGPDDKIDLTNPDVQAKFIQAQFPHESAGGGYVLNPADVAKGVQMAAANRGRTVQAPGTVIAAAAQPSATPPPTQYAGPGAPGAPTLPPAATETPPGPAQPPGAAAAPAQPGSPQGAPAPAPTGATGMQSPQFQRAMQLERQAAMLEAGPGGQLPQNKAMADYLHTQAKAILGTDTFQQIGGGMQRNVLTGETKYSGPPTARSTTDNDGNTWILAPGQPPTMLHANVSGVTGSGPEASALRTMNEIAPKIQAGIPLTPQEQANYASATEIYRNPTFVEDTNTGKKVRAYTRDLPPNFPPPPAAGAQPSAESQVVIPGMAPGTKKAEEGLGADFATTDKKSYDTANASLGMLVNANNAAEVMNRTPGSWSAPGAGANTRLELAKTLNTVSGLFGGGPVVDPAQISAWEALNKQTRLMGMQVVNSYFGGSREAASIINGATSAVPNSENSYLGFRLVSSGIEQDLLRQKELYEYKAQRVAANQPLVTAEAEFNKANPVQTYTARAIANAVPDDIAAHLIANPDTVKAFDQHFGPGIGEFILKGGRSGMGRAGVPSNG